MRTFWQRYKLKKCPEITNKIGYLFTLQNGVKWGGQKLFCYLSDRTK